MAFLPDAATLAAFTVAGLILTLTPGPDMTLFLSKTLGQGRAAGIAAMLGASAGLVAHTMLAAFGLSALLAASATAFAAVKIAGALYLIWLAIQAVRHGSALTLEKTEGRKAPLMESFLAGLGINLLNPKVVLFFVTFLPQFVTASDPSASAKLVFLGFYFLSFAMPLCLLLILTAERFTAAVRRSKRLTRALDWGFAALMGAFAIKILSSTR